uniref:Terepressin/terephysin n=1 Tax=Terebra subulata TaxID=89435 RepID=TESS_TERSU|nr:RecName: Full=Terepressin/terephysin; AltName: Full=Conopressin/Conophysin-like; Contains: RecName: Full=Terepressin; AltName: Full=Conopressin-like; Contains: RecName: Full=Terephysin; AltName: Full=Conophysin-like; Flags: Precursor [Terebra subulata]
MKCSVLPRSRLSWTMCVLLLPLLMLMLEGGVQGCFIRNCPRGGKRAVDSVQPTRQCMSCGPEGVGQCVGPSICCGLAIGCLMGTSEAEVCQKENESSAPCAVSGRHCGMDNTGNCVADGICCVEDACSFNSLCR